MAQYDTQISTLPEPPKRSRWPLAAVFWIDLAIVLALLMLMSMVAAVFVSIRALQEGLISAADPASARSLTQEMFSRMLGPAGWLVFILAQNAIFVAVPVGRMLLRGAPLATIGLQAQRWLYLGLFGLGLGVLVLIGNLALSALFSSLGIVQNQAEQFPLYPGDYAGQLLFFVSAAIIAPIGEEVLFRGYAFNAFRQSWEGRRWGLAIAFVLSALLFMVPHWLTVTQGALGLLVPTFVMGLALAWGVYRSGSLLPSIIAHAVNNSVALMAVVVCVNNPGLAHCSQL